MSISKSKKNPRLDRPALERLAAVFRAFGDATRLGLLQELKHGPRSVNELQSALGTSQANVSRQLKVLHEAGLLTRRREGAQVHYAIGEPLVMELCNAACRKLNRETGPAKMPAFGG